MKMQGIFLIAIFSLIGIAVSAQSRSDSIRSALEYQRRSYPASQYCDVYKNFMQDYFGPRR